MAHALIKRDGNYEEQGILLDRFLNSKTLPSRLQLIRLYLRHSFVTTFSIDCLPMASHIIKPEILSVSP